MERYLRAAQKLHRYLIANHWDGEALIGPDVGIRFNYRIGRFVKSYLRGVRWKDCYYYVQAQGYWVLGNWRLFILTGEERCREVALRASRALLARQRDDGAWEYPNREWKGRIATAEGTWGSLGLLESYRQTGDPAFLVGALRWRAFLIEKVGFQQVGEELAVNYFAGRQGARVPNNSAFLLRFLAELAEVSGNPAYLQPCGGLMIFVRLAQMESGELAYSVEGVKGGKAWPHFQCYQYNAFQCLDLMRYHEVAADETALPLIAGVLGFLRRGLAEDGHCFYQCGNRHTEVTYHTAALAAAFAEAMPLGIEGYDGLASRAYSYLLGRQRPDGSFPHSRGDYRFLSDQRSYPRNLSMIMYHLLLGQQTGAHSPKPGSSEGVAR